MKKIISISLALFIAGCTPTSIKIQLREKPAYSQYGGTPERNFYFDKTTGTELRKKWEAGINGSFQNSMITAAGDYIFINDLSGRVYCISINDGKLMGQLKHDDAVYTTPVIHNNLIIYAAAFSDKNKSDLFYYDVTLAKEIYKSEIKGRILTHLVKGEDGILFTTESGRAYKYDFKGVKIWEAETKARTHSSPAMKENILIFGNDNGEIVGIDSKSGKILYQNKVDDGSSIFGSISIKDSSALFGNDSGSLFSVSVADGNILWQFKSGERIIMSPAFDEENIFYGDLSGMFYALDNKGELKWEAYLDGVLNASPLVTANYLYIPNLEEKFSIVEKESGKIVKTYFEEGRVKLTPVFYRGYLLIGYDNGIIKAYETVD